MHDSIFTKIIKGEIPAHIVYEDDMVLAFLDIHPLTPGHTLIVPKKQVEFLWDLDDDTYHVLTATAKRLALHLRHTLGVPYVGEKVIGIDVPHAHIHLIPFTDVAQYHAHSDMSRIADDAQLAALANKLRL
jgi:histidine triad (HIT) family protein